MNEISVKVEDFPKDESNCSEVVEHAEVDPLALESDVKKELDPLDSEERQEVQKSSCDNGDTKEETLSEGQNTLLLQVKEIKDDLLKEDKLSSSQEEPSQDSSHETKGDCEESKQNVECIEKEESGIKKKDPVLEKCATSVIDIKEDTSIANKEISKNKEVIVEVEMKNITNDELKIIDPAKTELQSVNGLCTKKRHDKVLLVHDNARLHVAKSVKIYLEMLQWEVLHHPPYSPDITPSHFHLFRIMAHGLADQHSHSYEEAKKMD
ncbi:Mariner Mos1 transposase [Eumeta japonica]|uniref:Mariner Mos1 transposase n=1 Tax=Eumeta variegata TaxID=151549 RepID=A0A4C1U3U6_EUMVA|nr:Mariner Mos1 transposase [Eumeta japonica]